MNAIKDIKGWQSFILKYGKSALNYFQQGLLIEKELNRAPESLDEAKQIKAKFSYKNYQTWPALAELCMQYNLAENIYDRCLEIRKKCKTTDNLPPVFVNGKSTGLPGYFIIKLPLDAPEAFVLGHITHCCQSIGGDAEQCVIDGLTRANNGFYVLLKGDANQNPFNKHGQIRSGYKIVGQAYAWLNPTKDVLVLDSWESYRSEDNIILESLIPEFGNQVTSNTNIISIRVGGGGRTPEKLKYVEVDREIMLEGVQYPDSKKQYLVYVNRCKLGKFGDDILEAWINANDQPLGMKWDAFWSFISTDKLGLQSEFDHIKKLFTPNNAKILNKMFSKVFLENTGYSANQMQKNSIRQWMFINANILIDYFSVYDFSGDIIVSCFQRFIKKHISDIASRLYLPVVENMPEILAKLHDKGVLHQTEERFCQIYELFLSSEFSSKFLENEKLFTNDNIKILLNIDIQGWISKLEGLKLLHNNNLLTAATRSALEASSPHEAIYVADNMITLLQSEQLTKEDISLIAENKATRVLIKNTNSQFLMTPVLFAANLKKLISKNLNTADNIEYLIKNSNYSDISTDSLIRLNENNLEPKEIISILTGYKHRKNTIAITDAIIKLHQAGIDPHKHRKLLYIIHDISSVKIDIIIELFQYEGWSGKLYELISTDRINFQSIENIFNLLKNIEVKPEYNLINTILNMDKDKRDQYFYPSIEILSGVKIKAEHAYLLCKDRGYGHGEDLLLELKELKKANMLTEDCFDAVINNFERSYNNGPLSAAIKLIKEKTIKSEDNNQQEYTPRLFSNADTGTKTICQNTVKNTM